MSEDEDRLEDVRARAAGALEFGRAARTDGAATLSTVVETVRRILRSDTASIARFSLEDRTITWLATSGFNNAAASGETTNPLRGEFAERITASGEENFVEVRGVAGDLPASEFPLHSAEGLRDLAFVRLRARGESLGVLAVGYREHHRLTPEERLQLEGLAEMAALACSTRSARRSESGNRPSTRYPTASSSTTTACASCAATWPRPTRSACTPRRSRG
jgi:GAF domain-containing protein